MQNIDLPQLFFSYLSKVSYIRLYNFTVLYFVIFPYRFKNIYKIQITIVTFQKQRKKFTDLFKNIKFGE